MPIRKRKLESIDYLFHFCLATGEMAGAGSVALLMTGWGPDPHQRHDCPLLREGLCPSAFCLKISSVCHIMASNRIGL